MNLTQLLAFLSATVAYTAATNADGTLPPIILALETLAKAAASPDAAPLIAAIQAITAPPVTVPTPPLVIAPPAPTQTPVIAPGPAVQSVVSPAVVTVPVVAK
jgi:hypothetical protein